MKSRSIPVLLGFLLLALGARAAEVTVFAAASLTDALQAIAQAYEPASGDTLRFNFGASSTLARQIQQGAPADLFFSADEAKMDGLARAGLLAAGTRRSLLSNTLVVVVNVDGGPVIAAPADLAEPAVGRLALAEPGTVPAGIYAKEWLQKIGLWARVRARVIPTENVRACLAAVASGNADAGIVYRTDAAISKKVKIVYGVPSSEGPAISYPLALLRDAPHAAAARKFAAYLAGPEVRTVFVHYGFLPVP